MVRGRRVASPLRSQEPPPPPHPESSGPHTSSRTADPPTKPRAGRAAFSPRCLRAGDGKHEHTNRASPRTLGTQWRRAGGISAHQSELSRCGARCPKRGSFRLGLASSFPPIGWLRGPLTRRATPWPGKPWPPRKTVQ